MLILIDGPEKAGKTTLAKTVVKALTKANYDAQYVHWGPFEPDDRIIAPYVKEAVDSLTIQVWDRGWPSEYVYATALGRLRRARNDMWLMEYLHGRATPFKYLLFAEVDELKSRRNSSDLPIDPEIEQTGFLQAKLPAYTALINKYDAASLAYNATRIITDIKEYTQSPFIYCGALKPTSKVAFVAGNSHMARGDRWLPFSYQGCEEYMRALGTRLLSESIFMFAHKGNPTVLKQADFIFTMGGDAAKWIKYYAGPIAQRKSVAVEMLRANKSTAENILTLFQNLRGHYGY